MSAEKERKSERKGFKTGGNGLRNEKRLIFVYAAFLAATALITLRFYRIADHHSRAQNVLAGQYTRRLEVTARKGAICDRNGILLSERADGFRTVVNPKSIPVEKYTDAAEAISGAGGEAASYYVEKLYRGEPFCADTRRRVDAEYGACYPLYRARNDAFLCHVLGYRNRDGKGMTGLMGTYDEYLSETTASSVSVRYEADATGAVMDGGFFALSDDRYNENDGMTLTIDEKIQKITEDLCDETLDRGAVVVTDPQSGEILALCSRPSYLPSEVASYLDSDRGELLNRALSGFTPGSVFKTAVAATALEENPASLSRTYTCKGFIDVGGTVIHCHNRNGHGTLTLREAFAQSCNPYFIDLGLSLGKEAIESTAYKMGLFRHAGVSLLPCDKGVFPAETLYSAELANLSVGQGDMLLSPVEVCSMISTAVTGKYRKPSLVKSLSNGGMLARYEKDGEAALKDETVTALKSLLVSCVADGTGYRAAGDISCGGKTATAQSGQKKDGKEVIHSWFAGYFPAEEPKYTVCVLCDGNGKNEVHPSLIFKMLAERLSE